MADIQHIKYKNERHPITYICGFVLCAQGVVEYNIVFHVHVASFHRYLDSIGDDICNCLSGNSGTGYNCL